jgi:hypothetical protein
MEDGGSSETMLMRQHSREGAAREVRGELVFIFTTSVTIWNGLNGF